MGRAKAKGRAERRRGKLFVISAPSGCGKTTLCRKLIADDTGLIQSISMTTRPPRKDERDGVDYRFVSERYFNNLVRKRAFLEYEENFGYLYGTPRQFVERRLKEGKTILLSIDVKGAMKVKRGYPRDSVLIFILPPSVKALRRRLSSRMADGAEAISKRLKLARTELSFKDRYDYRIVNDNLEKAYRRLKNIVLSETRSGG